MTASKALLKGYLQHVTDVAQHIANHPLKRTCGESPRTLARLPAAGRATKLYHRANEELG